MHDFANNVLNWSTFFLLMFVFTCIWVLVLTVENSIKRLESKHTVYWTLFLDFTLFWNASAFCKTKRINYLELWFLSILVRSPLEFHSTGKDMERAYVKMKWNNEKSEIDSKTILDPNNIVWIALIWQFSFDPKLSIFKCISFFIVGSQCYCEVSARAQYFRKPTTNHRKIISEHKRNSNSHCWNGVY